ncbi:MAG: hypothetical protein ACRCXT_20545 [Paraclostridium sp.]
MDYLVVDGDVSEFGICNCVFNICKVDNQCRGYLCGSDCGSDCGRLGCCSQGGRSLPTRLFTSSK